MSVPGQGDPGVDVPIAAPALPAIPDEPSILPSLAPDPVTPATDELALTLQTLADRVAALEKTGSFAPGMIAWTAGPDAPPGWMIADGSAFDVNLYAALAIVCPTGFLPNLVDKTVMGAGTTYPLLSTGGAAVLTLTAAQSGMPAHMHTVAAATGSTTPAAVTSGSTTPGVTGSTTPAAGNTGGTTPNAVTTGGGSSHSHAASGGQFVQSGSGGTYGWTTGPNTISASTYTAGESGHTHSVPGQLHTHTVPGVAHTHTESAHTHTVTGAAHTHTLPDTDSAAGVGASASISTLSPYVALTPLIHI